MKPIGAVIGEGSDMGHRLSEDEVQQALDFCEKQFVPMSPDGHRAAERGGSRDEPRTTPNLRSPA